ncbi:hypothetical protein Mapa_006114 [Marchantia paleacea]|nr:hypothetical protein Mapa_006114 [Marchantia paleacea]
MSWSSEVQTDLGGTQFRSVEFPPLGDSFLLEGSKASALDPRNFAEGTASSSNSKNKPGEKAPKNPQEAISLGSTSSDLKDNRFHEGVPLSSSSLHYVLAGSYSGSGTEQTSGAKAGRRKVTPLTLGLETAGGVMTVIIPRNTPVPTTKRQVVSTYVDNQTELRVQIFEGERLWVCENNMLGSFELAGIPPAVRGVIQITVCFDIDAEGILNVLVEGKTTGQLNRITISNVNERPDEEKIAKMIQDADMYKVEDTENRKKIDSKNSLENFAYDLRNFLIDKKVSSRLDPHIKEEISDSVESVINWLLLNNWLLYNHRQLAELDEIELKRLELQNICSPILENLSQGDKNEAGRPPQSQLMRYEACSPSLKPRWRF